MIWFEYPANITFLAKWLVNNGADGLTIFNVFESPWDFEKEFEEAIASETRIGL
jgi:hypothetical protein